MAAMAAYGFIMCAVLASSGAGPSDKIQIQTTIKRRVWWSWSFRINSHAIWRKSLQLQNSRGWRRSGRQPIVGQRQDLYSERKVHWLGYHKKKIYKKLNKKKKKTKTDGQKDRPTKLKSGFFSFLWSLARCWKRIKLDLCYPIRHTSS